ncbi:MAG: hypothetical protein CVU62_03395 [Deltaproteobacteria bacterium HGW-Deltaproteobacteria-2]|jgi:predicted nucleic acid-binding protein|nr:MAG: hypothetical protein CVU62_03395 [Deltaproteobacteria bacterium HGW-Deltaproteobacteria-2]
MKVRGIVASLLISLIFVLISLGGCSGGGDEGASGTSSSKKWTHPASLSDNISPDAQNAGYPSVAMDNNGNAIIVWQQSDGTGYGLNTQIFKSEYRNGTWANPSNLSDNISPDGSQVLAPEVAMDNNGNAIIVWMQYDGANYQVFKSEYRNGSWTHPANLADNISPDGQDAEFPHIAMDNNGNAIIVWDQNGGTFKSEYRNGSWIHPANLSDHINPAGGGAYNTEVAMDNDGNAIIVWEESDGFDSQIFKSEYRNGSWIHPSSLTDNISPDGSDARVSHVAMDNDGNAIIVWMQYDGPNYQIFKSEYRNGIWTHPSSLTNNISLDGTDAEYPNLAMDDNGNAIIVWNQSDGTNSQTFKSEYRNGSWTHPSSLTDNISPDGYDVYLSPHVSMDNNGNAIIVWDQNGGTFKSEYRNGSWTHPANLSDHINPGGGANNTEVAMDNNGNAIIVWSQDDGTNYQIFKSEYR